MFISTEFGRFGICVLLSYLAPHDTRTLPWNSVMFVYNFYCTLQVCILLLKLLKLQFCSNVYFQINWKPQAEFKFYLCFCVKAVLGIWLGYVLLLSLICVGCTIALVIRKFIQLIQTKNTEMLKLK